MHVGQVERDRRADSPDVDRGELRGRRVDAEVVAAREGFTVASAATASERRGRGSDPHRSHWNPGSPGPGRAGGRPHSTLSGLRSSS